MTKVQTMRTARHLYGTEAGESTRQRILDAAVAAIERFGEPGVRVVDVASDAGVTQAMVNYYFRSRDALVDEAQQVRFNASLADDVAVARAALTRLTDADEVRVFARRLTEAVLAAGRDGHRRTRLNALGHAAASPVLWDRLAGVYTDEVSAYAEVFGVLQERGIVRAELTPRAMAAMTAAYSFGLVLNGLDRQAPSTDELAAVIEGFLESFIVS